MVKVPKVLLWAGDGSMGRTQTSQLTPTLDTGQRPRRWQGTFRAEGAWGFEGLSQNICDAENFAGFCSLLKEKSGYGKGIKLKIQLLCHLKKTSSQRTWKASRCFMKSGESLNIQKDNRVYKIKYKPHTFFLSLVYHLTNSPVKMFRFIKRPNSPCSQYFWLCVLDTHRNLGQDISMLALLTLH